MGFIEGGVMTRARAVNNEGQVVGRSGDDDWPWHAFSWTQAGGMVDLGVGFPYGLKGYAYAVNDVGQVAGWSEVEPSPVLDSNPKHAVLWKTNATGEIELLTVVLGDMNLAKGLTKSLNAKLAASLAALSTDRTATACDALASFVDLANAQGGKKHLTLDQAKNLVASALDVRNMLQCP